MRIAIRRTRALAAAILAAGSLSCFEQPITESMEIRFLAADADDLRKFFRDTLVDATMTRTEGAGDLRDIEELQ